jgi:hypothetical protein
MDRRLPASTTSGISSVSHVGRSALQCRTMSAIEAPSKIDERCRNATRHRNIELARYRSALSQTGFSAMMKETYRIAPR